MIKLGLLFGGKTAEHEISVLSAKSIANAVDKNKYDLILIWIDKNGNWFLTDFETLTNQPENPKEINYSASDNNQVALIPYNNNNAIINISDKKILGNLDVVFCIIHGTLGEDGALQGYFRVLNLPFVGPNILGSAIGMDKEVTKKLLIHANINVAKYLVFSVYQKNEILFNEIKQYLGLPMFVKPVAAGSSVGVYKIKNEKDFYQYVDAAFKFDNRIIIEEFIDGREIECAVLGNNNLIASVPGEIIPQHEFYSYEAKYIDENGAILKMPADLPENIKEKVKTTAKLAFKALHCEGLARVDFFLKKNDELILNEINTLPGFTKISMYPKLMELSGIQYSELINKLIELAFERYIRENEISKNS
jgi:D-alanine-D-alanine ligase